MKSGRYLSIILGSLGTIAQAQPPNYDFQFATVGAPGNVAFNNPSWPYATVSNGRGSVNYEYRISTLEVTTSQWMEFVNTYSTQGVSGWTWTVGPSFWGAQMDTGYGGPGVRWKLKSVPNAAMFPVTGISWRESAMFCNWLHNGKSNALSAKDNGSYDTSTFTTNPNGTFNDQRTHHPDAKYWIPTLDERMKAVHYDPNRYGPGQEGWWLYPLGSDDQPVGGLPGQGQANSGFDLPGFGHWNIPLGSYPESLTPWGLLDASGASSEWIEYTYFENEPRERGLAGSWAGGSTLFDHANELSSLRPWSVSIRTGLRIASAVPAPSSVVLVVFGSGCLFRRRR
ncbi:MAG: SUMF1/EgtB/PvdO family nonheme iron enzyme [Phycisphaerales bacterium]